MNLNLHFLSLIFSFFYASNGENSLSGCTHLIGKVEEKRSFSLYATDSIPKSLKKSGRKKKWLGKKETGAGSGSQEAEGMMEGEEELLWRALLNEVSGEEEDQAEQNWEEMSLQLEDLRRHPISLNRAQVEDMEKLPFVTPFHVQQFFTYRMQLGLLDDVLELQSIPGWTPLLIRFLRPYVKVETVDTVSLLHRITEMKMATHQWSLSSQLPIGAPLFQGAVDRKVRTGQPASTGDYYGTEWGWQIRYRFKNSTTRAGLAIKKDRGEPFRKEGKMLAHSSFFYQFSLGKKRLNWYLGDYVVQWGQGLVQWQGSVLSGSLMQGLLKQATPLRVHTGSDPFRFHRGIAVEKTGRSWRWMYYASVRKLSSNMDVLVPDSMNSPKPVVRTILTSGYHRTALEISRFHNLSYVGTGGWAEWKKDRLKWSIYSSYHLLSHRLQPDDEKDSYKKYQRRGASFINAGTHIIYTGPSFLWFAEMAIGNGGRAAVVSGLVFNPAQHAEFGLSARSIPSVYHHWFSQPSGQSSAQYGEKGMRMFYNGPLFPKTTFGFSWDVWRGDWLRYRISGLPFGGRKRAALSGIFSDRKKWHIQWQERSYLQDVTQMADLWGFEGMSTSMGDPSWPPSSNELSLPSVAVGWKELVWWRIQQWEIGAEQSVCSWVNWVGSIAFVHGKAGQSKELSVSKGWMLQHRIRILGNHQKIHKQSGLFTALAPQYFDLAYFAFANEGTASRFFVSEPSLPQSGGIQMVSGTGHRLVLMGKWKMGQHNALWVRTQIRLEKEKPANPMFSLQWNLDW